MKTAARLQAAIDILDEIALGNRPADTIFSSYFKTRRYAGSKDRRSVHDLVFVVLRSRARLSYYGAKTALNAPYSGRHLALILLTVDPLRPTQWDAPLDSYFSGDTHAPAPLDAAEQEAVHLLRNSDDHTLPEAIQLELPDWLYPRLKDTFGDDLASVMAALNSEASLDLRINQCHPDAANAQAILRDQGLETTPTPLAAFGLRAAKKIKLTGTKAYKEGLVEIQDEGSQLIASLCEAAGQDLVIDFCAGAGGKSLALGAEMQNQGTLYALDLSPQRLFKMRKRLERAALTNVTLHPIKGALDPWLKQFENRVDRLLIDAPCSGIGAWRRSPESRWKLTPDLLDDMHQRQAQILDAAAALVKVGGRIIYATCSLLPSENEAQITQFLEKHPNYRILPLGEQPNHPIPTDDTGFMTLRPDQTQSDGFFTAVLEKQQ